MRHPFKAHHTANIVWLNQTAIRYMYDENKEPKADGRGAGPAILYGRRRKKQVYKNTNNQEQEQEQEREQER